MPPKGHAVLSASSSERWLHCPPSARLCESYEDKGSDYAAEGTDAHELCEYKSVLFGDLQFYWIGDRQGVTFRRLNERYAETGQVGFLASKRVDGKLILPEAIKVLQQHA